MRKKPKWTNENLDGVSRNSEKWKQFVDWQKQRIIERLERYNNINTVKNQLLEQGEPSPYQKYKISVVSKYLQKALKMIENNNYGICLNCKKEIPIQRLLFIPGALNCMECENNKTDKNKPWENGNNI